MFTINVTDDGTPIRYKFKNCVSPCSLKFFRYTDYKDCLEYLKANGINYTVSIDKRHPMRKVNRSSTISLNATIGGRP